ACLLFAFHYSRIPIIRHELSGVSFRSNVERSSRQQNTLQEKGESIHILHLQGYIFFGSAYPLLLHLKEKMEAGGPGGVKHLLLDFGNVSGLDSSSLHIFSRIAQVAETNGVQLVFSGLVPGNEALLVSAGCIASRNAGADCLPARVFPDLDYAMDWCEEEILREEGVETEALPAILEDHFAELFQKKGLWAHFRTYLDRLDMEKDAVLFQQGEPADDMVFVESGEVTAYLELAGGERKRLRTMGAGTVIGEMGLYLGTPRSATVVTERPSVLYRLTLKNFEKMEEEHSVLANMVHRFIVRILANRLAHANREIFHLLKD
ncbi:MAG TPA: cyclic nucleotide-binding domain-containing protein, partial [Syntrophales bacterium]|nr:cyclic nucleotide-binding domain-containing protein [Syntrophales bacterium]